MPHNHKNSPTSMNRPPPDGYRSPLSHSTSPDSLTRSHSEHNRIQLGTCTFVMEHLRNSMHKSTMNYLYHTE